MSIENFLANFSFLTLFLSMIFYWVEMSVYPTQKTANVQGISTVIAFDPSLSTDNSLINEQSPLIKKKIDGVSELLPEWLKNLSFANLGIIISNLSLFLLLILRWKESGHFPLSNLYESLMFLSWTLTTIHIFLNGSTTKGISQKNAILGSITSPSALLTNAFATFSLPKEMQLASPLVPALQSNWLMMHVTVMILSYGALICGSLLSIAFLVITSGKNTTTHNDLDQQFKGQGLSSSNPSVQESPVNGYAQTLDNLSYRILGIGFPLLTIGILSGAVWANEAWGSYWSWDPKETWALLTWFVFAIYLHTRLTKGWQGEKPALIASLGFVSVWVCYLGVNLLGEGLHSYGWFS